MFHSLAALFSTVNGALTVCHIYMALAALVIVIYPFLQWAVEIRPDRPVVSAPRGTSTRQVLKTAAIAAISSFAFVAIVTLATNSADDNTDARTFKRSYPRSALANR